ncbi:hypothetical protein [Myxococcus qinghaiensis]|uniref:hypothetical protein n=1 Tax=Myxococcus qinghaiensis TaxID=2906758 RepID=UPI0020A6DD46|nr:hypothetical protein [Myxococcus qinghaiensis]MCP3166125.1 hypothetical protein [Myxococcus qinghaiensis]
MSHLLRELLGRAQEALTRREDDAALTLLLEAWNACRAEPVIALIEQLSDHLATGLAFFEVPVRWMLEEVRGHPTDLPRVLGELRERAARRSRCAFSTDLDRLRRWWPADPRIIPLLLALVRLPGAETPAELNMLSSLFMYVGAPYDVEPLRELKARLPSTQGAEVERFDLAIRLGARWVPPELASLLSANSSVRRLELKSSFEDGLADALTALPHLTWLTIPHASTDLFIRCAHSRLASQLEYFKVSGEEGSWRLEVTRGAEVPIRASVSGPHVQQVAPVLLAAARFSSQGLRIEFREGAEEKGGAPLREALAAHARVIRE